MLIAAQSGRALAAAARRSGYRPLVADQFEDVDTREIAADTRRVRGAMAIGPLTQALDALATTRAPVGLAYGSGFEDRPALIGSLAGRFRLLGNPGATLARVKDPMSFARLCTDLGVPHPETTMDAVGRGTWLVKRSGATGGAHIRVGKLGAKPPAGYYCQRRVSGTPISALFLASGGRAALLGFSEQWPDPAPRCPFRYGGAIRPASPAPAIAAEIASCVGRLAAALGLVGLNSADCLVRGDGFHLLEINPRPGATLDVFGQRDCALFQLHVDACEGRLPADMPVFPGAEGAAVVYAPHALRLPANFARPEWTADRQLPLSSVGAQAPLCTVLAHAETADDVRRLLERRRAEILARAGAVG